METCQRCGQEVRYGVRNPTSIWPSGRWMHRDPADDEGHAIVFGQQADWGTIERNLARQVADRASKKKRKGEGDELEAENDPEEADDDDQDAPAELPEPEQRATPMDPSGFAGNSGVGLVLGAIKRNGWTLRSLTLARGPYVGANGKVLSISDIILLRAAGPEVDGVTPIGVASWRDGKFDFAYAGLIKDGVLRPDRVSSTALRAWIKENPTCPTPPAPPTPTTGSSDETAVSTPTTPSTMRESGTL